MTSSSSSALPNVTLVGRPNVGKSTLFNRLVGKRQAIVAEIAGTTRDRLEQVIEWNGKWFCLTDMAGLEVALDQNTELARGTQAQVQKAMSQADLLIWIVDGSVGVTGQDQKIAELLRKSGKPVMVAVNKCDHPNHDDRQLEFSRYPFDGIVTLSAMNGRGVNDLLDQSITFLPEVGQPELHDQDELRLSIVGRPNVGKSTLLNALADEERSVVSDVPGTTRDMVDTVIPAEQLFGPTFTKWKTVRVIDTAGIRRRGKVGQGIEYWSVARTISAVKESEVCLFLIDAMEGMVHQDLQIAQQIVDAGRAVILIVNKWDKVLDMKKIFAGTEEDDKAQEIFLTHLRVNAPFLHWIQVLFVSATENLNLHVIGRLTVNAYNGWNLQVTDEQLDELATALRQYPRLKNLQKIVMTHNRPPVFHLHVEGKDLPHFSTVRYVENALRENFAIGPVPIKIWSVPSMDRDYIPDFRKK
ncbi:MAG: GTP-binding protein [Patescibacteria group bacterium]|nr:GTP-binding protein [Patescibacteria group bacterium]